MANLVFRSRITQTDPQSNPVLIIGQVKHLTQLRFNDIRPKLEPRVNEETFKLAVSSLHPSPTDSRSLWLNLATVAALPVKCSRHNTPSRAHSITKIVQSSVYGDSDESIVVSVCLIIVILSIPVNMLTLQKKVLIKKALSQFFCHFQQVKLISSVMDF